MLFIDNSIQRNLIHQKFLCRVKNDKKLQRADIGAKTTCPVCKVEFTRKVSLIRHMKKQHQMTAEQVAGHEEQGDIKITSFPCKHCGKFFTQVWKHKVRCSKKPLTYEKAALVMSDPEPEQAIPRDTPLAFESGGSLFLPGLKMFLTKQVGKITAVQYYRKAVQIAEFWERRMKHFRTDKLLFAMDCRVMVPSLSSYLASTDTIGAKTTAIKTYKYIISYSLEVFDAR